MSFLSNCSLYKKWTLPDITAYENLGIFSTDFKKKEIKKNLHNLKDWDQNYITWLIKNANLRRFRKATWITLDSGPIFEEMWFVMKWINNKRENAKIEAFSRCLISSSASFALQLVSGTCLNNDWRYYHFKYEEVII